MATSKRAGRVRNADTAALENALGRRAALRTEPRTLAFAIGTALFRCSFAYADVAPNALPTGGQYTYGSGSIAQQGDNKLQVTQTTDKGTINWTSFSIGSSAWVDFSQPAASSITVNRVLGNNPSEIFGRMTANGQVFLSNANGVLFAPSASVDVGALFATTLTISDQDANAGRYTKWSNPGNSAAVVNQGNIITANGYTALAAPQVRNEGVILAYAGRVTLAAGDRVSLDMIGDGLIKVNVDEAALNASAINSGTIQADGGNVLLTARSANALLDTVVNNSGIIRANSLIERNGEITLDGGSAGLTSNSGTLQAAGVDGGTSGGTVRVLGDKVALLSGSLIDMSGDIGGGTALVGGNFHGAGPEQNASSSSVDAGASINADAIATGDGGRIAIWSDGDTIVAGSLTSRGGARSGNGGFIETSGSQVKIRDTAYVNTLAKAGKTGMWLLDPADYTIALTGGDETGAAVSGSLALTDRTISVDGSIFVQDAISWATTSTLTLISDNTGTGAGSVAFSGAGHATMSGGGTMVVYYNASSYASLTDYSSLATGGTTLSHAWVFTQGNNKVYDSTTAASLSFVGDPTGGGANLVSLGAGAADFDTKNVGTGKTITYNGYSLGGGDAGKFALFATAGTTTADVTQAALTISGITASNKVYDATTAATVSTAGAVYTGLLGTDAVTVSATGTFADKNVGTGKTVNLSSSYSGADVGNYAITDQASTTANITQAPLTISGITASNKVYDATTAATVSTAGAVYTGLLGTDAVTVSATGTFADKNVGTGKTVNLSSSYSGADVGNYAITDQATTTANITTATISSVTGIAGVNKVYNGTTVASLDTAGATFTGMFAGDSLNVATASGTFADKNVGTGKAVSISGITLGGPDAGNYALTTTTASSTADITRNPSVTWTGAGGNSLWSNAANWAGVIPDLANVANVNLNGASVVFDNTVPTGTVQVDSISNGSLTVTSGTLNTSSISTTTFTQTGGTITSPGDLTIAATGALKPGTISIGTSAITLNAGSLLGGGPITAGSGTFSSTSNVATVNLNSSFSGKSVLLTGNATSWTFCDAGGCGSAMTPPSFSKTSTDPVDIFFNGVNLGSSAATVSTVTGSIGGTVSQIATQALQDALDTDSVQKQIDYGFAGDVGTTPPMDHRIDETGISTPECFEQSREGEPCKN